MKEGAIVIDVGANAPIEGDKTGIVGDVDFENVKLENYLKNYYNYLQIINLY